MGNGIRKLISNPKEDKMDIKLNLKDLLEPKKTCKGQIFKAKINAFLDSKGN